jgi:hypothetical protein
MRPIRRVHHASAAVAAVLVACLVVGTDASAAGSVPPRFHATAYAIRSIPRSELPYVGTDRPTKAPPAVHDADGLPMKIVGSRRTYGPAGLAQYGLRYEDAYRRTGDPDYYRIARKVHDKLMSLGVRSGDAVFIPYRFDFAMHRIPSEVMKAPWYSAMAQGLALSLAVRLERDRHDPTLVRDADALFRSFLYHYRGARPWVVYIDGDRYLWLEEYPERTNPSDHTANGFNFALFGLYDYYQQTHSPKALEVLRGALTTMRHFAGRYRIPGSFSRYCLRHGKPQPKYHVIVTWQLEFLARISGDPWFHSMAALFRKDYH